MSSEGAVGGQRAENAPAYKSTPLRPAIIMTTVLVWALVVALIVRVPAWASVFLAILTGASFLAFLVGYVYLFVRDRESLRTGRARRSTVLDEKPDTGARGAMAAGGAAPLGLGEPAVISVPEAERVAERRPYQTTAMPNNGMHPTRDTQLVMLRQRGRRAGDAWRQIADALQPFAD